MKLLFRDYLASLRERDELDAILPDLLSELGFTVFSRPQRGTKQSGVDIAAVGNDEDGEQKLFLFSVKQGDLTRQSWDGSQQALRPSLNEILDSYIPGMIPKRYRNLKIIICLVFGGDMQEQVRGAVTGFISRHTDERISFDEWNGDKLAGLLLKGILREEIMPKAIRANFQKSVAMVDQPDIAYRYFGRLVHDLCETAVNDKSCVTTVRQLYIALWVLFVWARDINNVEAPYRASELTLLNIWNVLRPYLGKRARKTREAITTVLHQTIQLHIKIASEYLEQKILPHVGKRNALSIAVHARSSADVNLKLFDLLGRISLTGLWVYWLSGFDTDEARRETALQQTTHLITSGYQLINNNPVLFLPLQDEQAIEISLFLILIGSHNGNKSDAHAWLREMVERLSLTVNTHGRYPCILTQYRELVAHPREQTNEYRTEATAGSILIPILAAFLSALNDQSALKELYKLKTEALEHCTLQLWMPDAASDDGIFIGRGDHGVALCELPLSTTGVELVKAIRNACTELKDFDKLSAMTQGYWPLILMACRHYRMPVPPQFWINMVDPPAKPSETEIS